MNLQQTIESIHPQATDLRRRLHRIPELNYEEVKTAASIRAELDRLGIAYTAGVANAPTATVAVIGDTAKPCIAFRADIDALPIDEQTGVAYKSEHPGRMHACGHDGHTATLVGTAAVFKQIADSLPVCVKLFWQPAEEGGAGGKRLVEAGILDGRVGPKVTAVFGLHGWPGLKVGMVSTKPGALLASTDTIAVRFLGRGCHAAYPHWGADPIVAASEAVLNLQQFVSREFDPVDSAVITIAKFHAGTATNIIPDVATIEGTVRTLNPAARQKIRQSIQRRLKGIADACGCGLEMEWEEGYPPTTNDPKMADYVAQTARKSLGENRYLTAPAPGMGGEDFAYYLEKVPGCFFLLGVCPADKETYPSLHNDHFDFTDAAIPTGIRMFTELAMGWGRG